MHIVSEKKPISVAKVAPRIKPHGKMAPGKAIHKNYSKKTPDLPEKCLPASKNAAHCV